MNLLPRSSRCATALTAHPCNRRGAPRVRVKFWSTISANGIKMEGTGKVLDLSITGCQLETSVPIRKSSSVELRIHAPDFGWTIIVDEAVVQWVKGNIIGLCFVRLRSTEGDRLAWIIARSTKEVKQS